MESSQSLAGRPVSSSLRNRIQTASHHAFAYSGELCLSQGKVQRNLGNLFNRGGRRMAPGPMAHLIQPQSTAAFAASRHQSSGGKEKKNFYVNVEFPHHFLLLAMHSRPNSGLCVNPGEALCAIWRLFPPHLCRRPLPALQHQAAW